MSIEPMALVGRLILVLVLLSGTGLRLGAANSAENRVFEAAANAFRGTFYDRAEAEFADFAQKFPQSTRLPEAILFQAKARLEQTNYAGAIELLSSRLSAAANRADAYRFWIGQAYLRKGEYRTAAETFEKLIKDFPASPERLEAVLVTATARAKLSEWSKVAELLEQPNGIFQSAARTNAGDDLVLRGDLLLSESQL